MNSGFNDEQKAIIAEAIASAIDDCAKCFSGEIPYTFQAEDGYSKAHSIAAELFGMADVYRRAGKGFQDLIEKKLLEVKS